ncbi:hypothetical protein [Motilibacter rhizosphaerae]|uniref:hypothetical protein n=1 Tax=Motilibacter rhizosphaerae TaxID=598652 RepID=UPI0013EEDC26|nr:hypothetical protein [Motilibacter rhizosphaerae]
MSGHSSELEHRGSFAHAVCACGWAGPGRRALARARRDGSDHATLAALESLPTVPAQAVRSVELGSVELGSGGLLAGR